MRLQKFINESIIEDSIVDVLLYDPDDGETVEVSLLVKFDHQGFDGGGIKVSTVYIDDDLTFNGKLYTEGTSLYSVFDVLKYYIRDDSPSRVIVINNKNTEQAWIEFMVWLEKKVNVN